MPKGLVSTRNSRKRGRSRVAHQGDWCRVVVAGLEAPLRPSPSSRHQPSVFGFTRVTEIRPGILLAARLLVSRAGAPQGPISPTYQQAGANQMKRENHRSFLLLLFLVATATVEFRYGAVVAFRFADASVWFALGNKAKPADSERPRQLRERAHYGLICGPQRLSTILRSGNDVQPGLERFRHLKRGTTVPIPER